MTSPWSQRELSFVKKEANNYCACFEKMERQIKRLDQKAVKTYEKPKKYKPGDRLFGGESLDFSFADCLGQKRSSKAKNYLEGLDEEQKSRFAKKVIQEIRKECPGVDTGYY